MHRVEETQEPEANNELLAIGGRGWTSPLCTQQCPRPQDTQKPPGTGLQLASDSGLVLLREVGRHALALLASRAGTHHRVNLAFATHTVEIHPRCCTACASPRPCVRPKKNLRPPAVFTRTYTPYTRFFLQSLSTFAAVPLLLTGVPLHPPATKGGPTSSSADVSVPRPRTHDDRTGRVFPDHLITFRGRLRMRSAGLSPISRRAGEGPFEAVG
jgi:hypothetical protein